MRFLAVRLRGDRMRPCQTTYAQLISLLVITAATNTSQSNEIDDAVNVISAMPPLTCDVSGAKQTEHHRDNSKTTEQLTQRAVELFISTVKFKDQRDELLYFKSVGSTDYEFNILIHKKSPAANQNNNIPPVLTSNKSTDTKFLVKYWPNPLSTPPSPFQNTQEFELDRRTGSLHYVQSLTLLHERGSATFTTKLSGKCIKSNDKKSLF
jgi:hypothetical protein